MTTELKAAAFKIVDELFYAAKMESEGYVGISDATEFTFENKKYFIAWDGFWESSDHYDYRIEGEGIAINGLRMLPL